MQGIELAPAAGMTEQFYDVAIVGGGPAGLCSALWLARYLHKVVVVDSGDPRNWETRSINGYLGHQGVRSPELRALGREECANFGVEFVDGIVDTAIDEPGELFSIQLRGGMAIKARRILLAIGIKDVWPDIPGLERCYGETVHVCPDCDGYETRDRKTIVVGRDEKPWNGARADDWTLDRHLHQWRGRGDEQVPSTRQTLNIPCLELHKGVRARAVRSTNELEGGMRCTRAALFRDRPIPADDSAPSGLRA